MISGDSEDDNSFEVLISETDIKALQKQNQTLRESLESLRISSIEKQAELQERITEEKQKLKEYKQEAIKVQIESIEAIRQIFAVGLNERKNKYELVDQNHEVNKPDEIYQQMESLQLENNRLKQEKKSLEQKIVEIERKNPLILKTEISERQIAGKNSQQIKMREKYLEQEKKRLMGELKGKDLRIQQLSRSLKEVKQNTSKYISNLEKLIKEKEEKQLQLQKSPTKQKPPTNDNEKIITQMKEQIKTEIQSNASLVKKLNQKDDEIRHLQRIVQEKEKEITELKKTRKDMRYVKESQALSFEKITALNEQYLLEKYLNNLQKEGKGMSAEQLGRMQDFQIEKLIQQIKKSKFE